MTLTLRWGEISKDCSAYQRMFRSKLYSFDPISITPNLLYLFFSINISMHSKINSISVFDLNSCLVLFYTCTFKEFTRIQGTRSSRILSILEYDEYLAFTQYLSSWINWTNTTSILNSIPTSRPTFFACLSTCPWVLNDLSS